MSNPVTIEFAGLPGGDDYCFTGFQRFALDITDGLSGILSGNVNTFNYGSSEPSPDNRNKPWYRLNVDGSPDKWYQYFSGAWVSPYLRPATSGERMWWAGTEAELWSFDGGNGVNPTSVAPTATTGSFWQRDTTWDAKLPLQAGTLPNGTVVAIGTTGGLDEVKISANQLIQHSHQMFANVSVNTLTGPGPNDSVPFRTNTNVNAEYLMTGVDRTTYPASLGLTSDAGQPVSTQTPINLMNPYKAGFWAKRTARTYFTP